MVQRKPAAKKAAPRLKNYMSLIEVDASIAIIRRSLTTHGAEQVSFIGGDKQGNPTGITFLITVNGQSLGFAMPVHFDRVRELVAKAWTEYGRPLRGDALVAQAQRTSWANIRDWTLAQMALIESQGVKVEEVFFPYLLTERGETAFEQFEQRRLLPGNVTEGHYRIAEAKDGER